MRANKDQIHFTSKVHIKRDQVNANLCKKRIVTHFTISACGHLLARISVQTVSNKTEKNDDYTYTLDIL